MTRTQIREQIFKILFRVEFNSTEEMPEQLRLFFEDEFEDEDNTVVGAAIPDEEADYIKAKSEAIIERISTIDQEINACAKGWSTDRIGKVELAVLRLAVYEMLYDEAIPVGVAIDEAVDLAKKFGQENASAFINGILAGILKKNEAAD